MKLEPNFFNCINEWGANDAVVNTFGSALTVKQIGDRVLEISKDGELLSKVIEVRDNPGTFEIECGIGNISKAIGQVLKKCGGKIVDNSENGGKEEINGKPKSNENGNGKEQNKSNEEKVNKIKVDEIDKENNREEKGNNVNGENGEIQSKPKVEVNKTPSTTSSSKAEPTKIVPKIESPKKVDKSVPTTTTRSSVSDEFLIEEAERNQAFIRVGMSGPSGSGKTMGSLLVGKGLCGEDGKWKDIVIIDTEHGSGSLYTGSKVGDITIGKYRTLRLDPPYSPDRYIKAMNAALKSGAKVIILDSFSHVWSGEGGCLEIHDKVTQRIGNSYTAWREVTPEHTKLIEKILSCDAHVIVCVRAKTSYVLQTNEKGKQAPKEVGLEPIAREGLKYECTTFLELSNSDNSAVAGKDRTHLFGKNFFFTPGIETGEKMLNWLKEHPDGLDE
jgi:hypothetical protein